MQGELAPFARCCRARATRRAGRRRRIARPGRTDYLCWVRQRLIFLMPLLLIAAGAAPPIYRNEAMRVRAFEMPIGWEMAPQSSYPRLLASYSHQAGGRVTLSAQKIAPESTAAD